MSQPKLAAHEARVAHDLGPDDEEGCVDVVAGEHGQHLGRPSRVGTVIESESHLPARRRRRQDVGAR